MRRSELPVEIFSVNVTVAVLVEGRGIDESARLADARVQAAKWAGDATREVHDPVPLKTS